MSLGYINGILDPNQIASEDRKFFNIDKIPCIPQLLKNDLRTMVNAKKLINQGLDRERLIECFKREGQALFDSWMDPEFLPKMMEYIQANSQKKKSPKKKILN